MQTARHTPSPLAGVWVDGVDDAPGIIFGMPGAFQTPATQTGARLGGVPPSRSGRGGSPTRQELLARAKWMRANPTDAERRMWSLLRNKRFAGYKFKRQVVIERYIADFVNFDQRLIVEADGSQHVENAYDARRDAWLRDQGFTLLRFWNIEILKERDSILEAIWHALYTPSPLAGEGNGSGASEGEGAGAPLLRGALDSTLAAHRSAPPLPTPSGPPSPTRGEGC